MSRMSRVRAVGGELLLIIAGVLIALWADGRAADARNEAQLLGTLCELRSEIVAALEFTESEISEQERAQRRVRYLAQLSDPDFEPPADSVWMLSGVFGGLEGYAAALPVYRDLQSSGQIPNIESDSLRRALATMEGTLQRLRVTEARRPQGDAALHPWVLESFPQVLSRVAEGLDAEFPRRVYPQVYWSPLRTSEGQALVATQSVYTSVLLRALVRLAADQRAILAQLPAQ